MIHYFGKWGRTFLNMVQILGDVTCLTVESLLLFFRRPWQGRHILEQMYVVGVGSLVIILITGAFTGMVLALQGYYSLAKFGSESLLGSLVALSIIRELGPVLGALMMTAQAGSSITAEIGIMRVTEQLDALKMMAVNPKARVLMPRILACVLVLPILITFFDIIGIAMSYVIGVDLLSVNSGAFIGEMQAKVETSDIYEGWIKAIGFGLLIGIICTYMGYRAKPTTEGVSRATTRAVVMSSVGILALDYFLSSFFL